MTVIIPVLNEAGFIRETVAMTAARLGDVSIVVVDGGSMDGTPQIAAETGAAIARSRPGRGVQCHLGALHAQTDRLLFLHADTMLPCNAATLMAAFIVQPDAGVASFRLSFDAPGFFLGACCWFTWFDSVFTPQNPTGCCATRRPRKSPPARRGLSRGRCRARGWRNSCRARRRAWRRW
ncbi:MAG: glycosyltransferase [Verrucomicrobia bacterium]|nr:glycosyltransferase [Verrucomicrobiota bacterium]